MDNQILVELDSPRAIRWTFGAEARLGSLPRPPQLQDLSHSNPRKRYFTLCAVVWASLDPKDNPFETPEDLAEVLDTDAKVRAASEAFMRTWRDSRPKKQAEGKKASAKPEHSPASSLASNGGSSNNSQVPTSPTSSSNGSSGNPA